MKRVISIQKIGRGGWYIHTVGSVGEDKVYVIEYDTILRDYKLITPINIDDLVILHSITNRYLSNRDNRTIDFIPVVLQTQIRNKKTSIILNELI